LHSWKGIDLRSSLDYKGFYTDRALSSAGATKEDFMHYFSPLIGLSRFFETEQHATLLSIAYQPTFVVSSLGNGGDRTYQLVRGNLSHLWSEKTVYLSHQFQDSSESSIQAAYLAPQQENRTTAGFKKPLTGKMNFEFEVEQILLDSSKTISAQAREMRSWVANAHVDYQLRPKLRTGVRFKTGYSEQLGDGINSKFVSESLLSTWSYEVSGKITLNLDAGGQLAQSQTAFVRDPNATPIATGRLIYEPRFGTLVTLGGGRSANASQFFSANFLTDSGADISLRQRIYQDFSVSARFGYSIGEYQSLISGATGSGHNYTAYNLSTDVQWRMNARLTAGLFYQFLSRVSELSSENYSASQIGMNFVLSL
jgi:hypothetical protein